MLFTSYAFPGFIAVLFLLYYLIPGRFQWKLLLAASYLFYFMAGPSWLLYILTTTATVYLAALRIEKMGLQQKSYLKAHREQLSKEEKNDPCSEFYCFFHDPAHYIPPEGGETVASLLERTRVFLDELKDFAECGLCGTAAVISPVGKIVDHGKEICFPSGMEQMGEITKKLYDTLTGMQMGSIEAPEGWIKEIL